MFGDDSISFGFTSSHEIALMVWLKLCNISGYKESGFTGFILAIISEVFALFLSINWVKVQASTGGVSIIDGKPNIALDVWGENCVSCFRLDDI